MNKDLKILVSIVVFLIGFTICVNVFDKGIHLPDSTPGTMYGVPFPEEGREVDRYDFKKGTWLYENVGPAAAKDTIDPNYSHPYYQRKDFEEYMDEYLEDWVMENENY